LFPAGTLTELRSVRSDELAISGRWKVIDIPAQSRINAIHAALLPTGKVLIIAGSGNSPRNFDAGSFSTLLWDPQTGQSRLIPTPDDMFCGGHTLLPDGNLLVAGGTRRYEVGKDGVTRAAGPMTVRNETSRTVRLKKGTRFISPRGIAFAATEQATVGAGSSAEVWVEAAEPGDGSVISEFTKYRVDRCRPAARHLEPE
jgi:hypothetical protein